MNKNHKMHQSVIGPAIITGFLLLIPLIGMQFSEEVKWTLSDFVIAGILLFSTGLTYKLITLKSENIVFRIAIGFALLSGLFLIWSNLAVGLIGSESNDINLLYFGVIAVGIIGSIIARFKSYGMVRTMVAMAFTQLLIGIWAFIIGMHNAVDSSIAEILGVNGFFVVLFLISAVLFYKSGMRQYRMKRNSIS